MQGTPMAGRQFITGQQRHTGQTICIHTFVSNDNLERSIN